jgi:hypothetical protein
VWVAEVTGVFGENDCINYNQHIICIGRTGVGGPAELRGATNSPEIRKDIAGLRKRNLKGLRVGEIGNVVQEHRICSCKRG